MFLSYTEADLQQMWQSRTQSYSVQKPTSAQAFGFHLEVFFKKLESEYFKQRPF